MNLTEEEQLILRFYKAFEQLDSNGMVNCYHQDIIFQDPAFGVLHGKHAGNMWRMLCDSQQGKGFKVTSKNIKGQKGKGSADWEAHYTFSQTGRDVHNLIHAQFQFKEGKIFRHNDSFDLYRWSKQAFGLSGTLIGWSAFFRNKLQKQTATLLRNYENKQNL